MIRSWIRILKAQKHADPDPQHWQNTQDLSIYCVAWYP